MQSSLSFGSLLKTWRTDRRLSQSALAGDIETTTRHLSFLENGRSNPSREMILRLCSALKVPLYEQNSFFHAAGFADPYFTSSLEAEELSAVRNAIDRIMQAHDPCPAFLIDRNWKVHDLNKSATTIFGALFKKLGNSDLTQPFSIFEIAFDPNIMRPLIANWENYARTAIQRIHRESLSNADLVNTLQRLKKFPDIPQDWWAYDIQRPIPAVCPIEFKLGDREAAFFSVVTSVAAPNSIAAQEYRVETLFPADETTEQKLQTLNLN